MLNYHPGIAKCNYIELTLGWSLLGSYSLLYLSDTFISDWVVVFMNILRVLIVLPLFFASSQNALSSDAAQDVPRTLTVQDWMGLDVFDIAMKADSAEVISKLEKEGFSVPKDNNGKALVGVSCEFCKTMEGLSPGKAQENAFNFERGEVIKDAARYTEYSEELVRPFFYSDRNRAMLLGEIYYERNFRDEVFPPALAEKLVERYGEPTNRSEGRDDTVILSYKLAVEAPQEFTPLYPLKKSNSNRSASDFAAEIGNRSAGVRTRPRLPKNRLQCLQQRVRDIDGGLPKRCWELLSYDFDAAAFYFVYGESAPARGPTVLQIKVSRKKYSVTLGGRHLAEIEAQYVQDQALLKRIEELSAKKDQPVKDLGNL